MTYLLSDGNLKKLIREAKSNPCPGIIGTFMGRDALALAVSFLDLTPNDTVLLPAYLCREVLRPLSGKARVLFYDVKPDLTLDLQEIEQIVAKNRVKMMMIINYFGFLEPRRKQIRQICSDWGIVLMEDCAHSLLTEGSGEIGDICIYSFRKIIPVPDGGGLKINMVGKALTPDFYPRAYSNVLSVLIMIKALLNVQSEKLSRAGYADRQKDPVQDPSEVKKNDRVLPLSSFTFNGLGNTSFAEIIGRRRDDYLYWQEVARSNSQIMPVFANLPPGVCPLGFPVTIKNRDLLRSRLQQDGVFLKVHWNLPEAVGGEYVNSRMLSTQMITFPVYPELGIKEREGIQRAIHS